MNEKYKQLYSGHCRILQGVSHLRVTEKINTVRAANPGQRVPITIYLCGRSTLLKHVTSTRRNQNFTKVFGV